MNYRIGPPIGAMLAPTTAPLATICVIMLCMLGTLFLVPESLSTRASEEAKERHAVSLRGQPAGTGASSMLAATWRAVAILQRSPLFIRLTAVLMMGAVVSEGLQDILIQYLQIKLNFVAADVSHLFMAFGAGALLVQGFLLRLMIKSIGERKLLVVGLVAGTIQQMALALVVKKWQVLAAVSLGSLGSVTFPTISSIKANSALEHEQGSVQGALYGARALASGVGPLAFAALFAAFTRSESPLPFYPGAPFILGAVLMAVTAVLAAGLPPSPSDVHEHTYVASASAVRRSPSSSSSGEGGVEDGVDEEGGRLLFGSEKSEKESLLVRSPS